MNTIQQNELTQILNLSIDDLKLNFISSIQNITKKLIESLISCEFMNFLEEIAKQNINASKNGFYNRQIDTPIGTINISLPRARYENFATSLIAPRQHRLDSINEIITSIYSKGLSENDIVEFFKEKYAISISRETVGKIVRESLGEYKDFSSKQLTNCPVIYLDGTWLPLKRRRVSSNSKVESECVLIAIGIDENGNKQVLSFRVLPAEGASVWQEVLEDLKNRGVNDPKVFVTDGLNGMKEAIHKVYPTAKQQRCLVHVSRNIANKVSKNNRAPMLNDFKEVYKSNTKEDAKKKLGEFLNKWATTYPRLLSLYDLEEEMFVFYDFPKSIHKQLYTSNPIEAFNSYAKRELRKRIQMNNEGFCMRIMTILAMQYNNTCRGGRNKLMETMSDDDKAIMGFKLKDI